MPIREIGLVAVLAVAVYVLLALGSHSPTDPAWTVAGSELAVRNLVGKSGAWTADIVLYAFGWGAYLLPLCLLSATVPLMRRHRRVPWSWAEAPVRGGGFVAVLVATCLLMRLHVDSGDAMPASAGGALGDSIARLGLPVFNVAGLTLGALAVFVAGSQAMLNYSWLDVLERIGRGVYAVAGGVWVGSSFVARSVARGAAGLKRTKVSEGRGRNAKVPRRRKNTAKRRTEPGIDASPTPPRTQIEAPAQPAEKGYQPRMFDLKTPVELPDLDLLEDYDPSVSGGFSRDSLNKMARDLEQNLAEFGVVAEVKSILPGPVVTRFELEPAPGLKVSRITSLVKDLARSLAVISVRVVEVIPGKSYVGIEIPNEQREVVRLKEILNSTEYRDTNTPLTLALGKDIAGTPVMADIGRMPHLLVAGTTGSGKSVGINAMLLSMLYKATPEQLRLILVDPKMLELSVYDGIPHLLTPVVTDMKDAAQALNWCIAEMERRYQLMAALGVRNIAGYNRRVDEGQSIGKPVLDPLWPDGLEDGDEPAPPLARLPFIVVVIDEFADMMMIVGKKVEQLIARLAQKARAAGIHLVLATQRPSVNVVTGLIKANIPARISFQVSSAVDSRTVLDQGGAEQLLGHGDMLFLPPGTGMPTRVHGAFVSDEEVVAVTSDWKERGQPEYVTDVLGGVDLDIPGTVDVGGDSDEPLYEEALAFVQDSGRASISAVQRKLRIGYNRAARLIEQMEEAGVVSAMNSNGTREVLVPAGGHE